MKLSIRKAKENEKDLLLKTVNLSFSDVRINKDYSISMPKVHSPKLKNAHLSFLLFENNKPVGSTGNYPIDFSFGSNTLNTTFIGMVGVIPTKRKKGYMYHLMDAALAEIEADNKDLAILTGQKQRYEYWQFYDAGYYLNYEINLANIKHFTSVKTSIQNLTFTEITNPDAAILNDIFNLYSRRGMTNRLRENFLYQLQSHTTKVYVVEDGSNYYGYLLFKEGEILVEYELLDNINIMDVLKEFLSYLALKSIRVIIMPWELDKQQLLNQHSEGYIIEKTVKIKVYNYLKLIKTLFEFTSKFRKLTDGVLTIKIKGINYQIKVVDNKIDVGITDEAGIEVNEKDFIGKLTIPNYTYNKLDDLLVNWFPLMFGIPVVDRI